MEAERWESRELLWVRARSASPCGWSSEMCCLTHTIIGSHCTLNYACLSGSLLWVRHLTHCLCILPAHWINAGWHIYEWKYMWLTQTPIIPLDINSPFMLWFMPAPPGLTGRHTRLRIWQQIHGTDGQSVQHHLSSFFFFFLALKLPRPGPNPPGTIHPIGKTSSHFTLSE